MEIFVIILGLAFLQIWGSKNPLHRDGWFDSWRKMVVGSGFIGSQELRSFFVVVVPVAIVSISFILLARQSIWLALPLAVIVLLYSFGRGEFAEIVREYTQACYVEDWESAVSRAKRFDLQTDNIQEGDWPGLHRLVFDEAAYRGFERMFAILFWFFLLGPLGVLMYRLVFLEARHDESNMLAKRWLWILEWPAARMLGLSFALTGNFQGCIHHWKECVLCVKRSTVDVLSPMILGALSVKEDIEPDCEVTRKELTLLSKLYQRTLWFWLAAVSIGIIFF